MVSAIKWTSRSPAVLVSFLTVLAAIADGEECTRGFLDSIDDTSSTIVAFPNSSLPNTDPLFDFNQWIFPNINFTCNGYITSWRLGVNGSTEPANILERPIPQITTWRLEGRLLNNYVQQTTTNSSQVTILKMVSGLVYYEYTPSEPTPVQAGDIIGILMPLDENDRLRSVRPLFLRLPEGNSSTISCVRLGNSQQIYLQNRMCINQQEQQSLYVPLVSAIFNLITPTLLSPSPTATTQSSITMVPTHSANPKSIPQGSTTDSTTTDLPNPVDSGTNSNINTRQLAGVIIGALLTVVVLLLTVILAIFLIVLMTKRKGLVSLQPQNIDNLVDTGTTAEESQGLSNLLTSQSIEVKNNDAYFTIYQIPTEENVAYTTSQATPQTTTEDNVAIATQDNVAYGQARPQVAVVVNGQATPQIPTADNVAYGQIVIENDYAIRVWNMSMCDMTMTVYVVEFTDTLLSIPS